ncbi:MAG: hypothetical protein RR286_04180, partial [Mucinivorans sp.]
DPRGLVHILEQKDTLLQFRIQYRDRIVSRDSIVVKTVKGDTVYRETVPRWAWWLLGLFVLGAASILAKLFLKR